MPILSKKETATPDGVSPKEWALLMDRTSNWPPAGMASGLERMAAILRGGGFKDAEAWVHRAWRGWDKGDLVIGPWAVFGRGWTPSEKDRGGGKGDEPRAKGADDSGVESIGAVLAKTRAG